MKLVNQEEARKIADKCKFKKHCHLCFYLGKDRLMNCCGFCADYPTDRCKGIVCVDFGVKLTSTPCQDCRLRDGECSRSQGYG